MSHDFFTSEEYSKITKLQRDLEKKVREEDNDLRVRIAATDFNIVYDVTPYQQPVNFKRIEYMVYIHPKNNADISLQSWILYKENESSEIQAVNCFL